MTKEPETQPIQTGIQLAQSFDENVSMCIERNMLNMYSDVAMFVISSVLSDKTYAKRYAKKDYIDVIRSADMGENTSLYRMIFKSACKCFDDNGFVRIEYITDKSNPLVKGMKDVDIDRIKSSITELQNHYKSLTDDEKSRFASEFHSCYDVCCLTQMMVNNKNLVDEFNRLSYNDKNIAKVKVALQKQIDRMVKSSNRLVSFADKSEEFYDFELNSFVPIKRIRIGVKPLDDFLKGGIPRGEVTMLVAPTGVGKTQWAIAMSDYISRRGMNVLHIDLEMNENSLRGRYFSRALGVPMDEINTARTVNKDYWESCINKFFQYRKNRIVVSMQNSDCSATTIYDNVQDLIEKGWKPDIILIDYFDKIAKELKDESNMNSHETEGHTFNMLERLASDTGAAVVTFSQCKKDANNKKKADMVSGDMVSGSAKKLEMSSLGLMFDFIEKEETGKEYFVSVLKNRNGRLGKIELKVDASCSRIYGIDEHTCSDFDSESSVLADLKCGIDLVRKSSELKKEDFFAGNSDSVPF